MPAVRSFHRYRGESSFTLQRLVAILEEQVPHVAPEQVRYRVTTLPTERTIRFYTAQRLVDKPAGREGQSALYGYRHLLQILAVKYLQSHYLPLRKIRSLVENATNRDLEQLMPEIAPANWIHRGFTRDDRRIGERPPLPSAPAAAPSRTPGDIIPSGREGPARARGQEAALPVEEAPDAWHRLEVGPGIELHVHAAALSTANRELLRGALLRELGALRGWYDGRGKE